MAVAGYSLASLYGGRPRGANRYDLPIVDEDGGELARQIEDRLSGDESLRVRRVASREEAQRLVHDKSAGSAARDPRGHARGARSGNPPACCCTPIP
jgi:hypothetical protein